MNIDQAARVFSEAIAQYRHASNEADRAIRERDRLAVAMRDAERAYLRERFRDPAELAEYFRA
jgi:hypothetical protein